MEEEIRYKPVSIRDLLAELQTRTTLIIDLAYSAVLFNDLELAEEVIELREIISDIRTLLLMNTAITIRDANDAESMVGIMRMGTVADRISEAAGEIARIVLLGLGADPVLQEAFANISERLVRLGLLPQSILVGKTLASLQLESNIGVDVIAVRRGKELTVKPKSNTILKSGDIIIARGSDIGVSELDKLAKGELTDIPRPKLDV